MDASSPWSTIIQPLYGPYYNLFVLANGRSICVCFTEPTPTSCRIPQPPYRGAIPTAVCTALGSASGALTKHSLAKRAQLGPPA